MALTLDLDPQAKPQWVSDRRICLTADGTVCDGADTAAATLLVAEGGQIDLDVAVKHGLANPDGTTIPPVTADKKPKAAAPKQPAKQTTKPEEQPPAGT